MAIIKGVGVVWGISTTAMSGIGAVKINGQTMRRASKEDLFMDRDGETIGLSIFDRTREIDLTVYPSSTTLSLASAANVLPLAGDTLVITDSADADIAGNWIVKDASKDKRSDGKVTFTVKAANYSTDLSGTIS